MNAYQDLMTALVARRPDQSAAEDDRIVQAALAKHAHELAEQIRAWGEGGEKRKEDWRGSPFRMYEDADTAADLIDSETERPVGSKENTR